jgi:MFS family permease
MKHVKIRDGLLHRFTLRHDRISHGLDSLHLHLKLPSWATVLDSIPRNPSALPYETKLILFRGIINTFGSYQAYYESDLLQSSNPSAISWIGSIQAFLLLIVGALSGPIYDRGYFRFLLLSGTFMLVLGQMMLSLCKEYWQVLLAQAFCIGIGCGALFIPSVAILSTYFTTRIATAVGIAASGSSLGASKFVHSSSPYRR